MKFYDKEMYIVTCREEEYPGHDGYPDINEEYFMSAGIFETLSLAKDWLKNYVSREIERREKNGHDAIFINGIRNRQTGERHYIGWRQENTEIMFFVEPIEFHEDKDGPF